MDLKVLDNDQFSLPGGCDGMRMKNSNDEVIKSSTYVNNEGCEAYFTSRYSKIILRF